METKQINYGEGSVLPIEENINAEENSFVNREFMRYFPVRQAVTNTDQLPTSPKNFFEQIQIFDDGVDKKLYLYINGAWVSVVLT